MIVFQIGYGSIATIIFLIWVLKYDESNDSEIRLNASKS